jgi:hypothetical protein
VSGVDKLFGRSRQNRSREYSKRLSQHTAGAQNHASMGFVLKIRGVANAEKVLADGNRSKLIHCGKGNDQILFV